MSETVFSGDFLYEYIIDMVHQGSAVLDLGCGDCRLLELLAERRGSRGRGVDHDDQMIQECIRRGISVFHGDLDEGLKDHPTGSYDVVVLSLTLQMIHKPRDLIQEMLRVGKKAIITFPNFAHLVNRIQLGVLGHMPVNRHIPYQWYDTPNIHFFTYRDFMDLCGDMGVTIERTVYFKYGKEFTPLFPNLQATDVCCLLGS